MSKCIIGYKETISESGLEEGKAFDKIIPCCIDFQHMHPKYGYGFMNFEDLYNCIDGFNLQTRGAIIKFFYSKNNCELEVKNCPFVDLR